jgi:hypothetical protein
MTVDSQARQMATESLAKLDSHERICGQRWTETREAIDRLQNSINASREIQNKRWWVLLIGIISLGGGDAVVSVLSRAPF